MHTATTVCLLPATDPPSSAPRTSTPRAAALPRPALTSEPLGVVLGGAEWGLRPKASVNYSITGLEICSCGRVQAALWRGGGWGSGEGSGICILALLGPPTPIRQPDPTPPSALHSGAWGKTKLGEGLRWGLPPATCLLLTAQVLTCKDGHIRLGGVKGAPSLPAQLLTLLLQRSDLEAEGAGSWNPWGLGVWSHSPLPVSSCFLPSPLLDPVLWPLPFPHPCWPVPTKLTVRLGSPPTPGLTPHPCLLRTP